MEIRETTLIILSIVSEEKKQHWEFELLDPFLSEQEENEARSCKEFWEEIIQELETEIKRKREGKKL